MVILGVEDFTGPTEIAPWLFSVVAAEALSGLAVWSSFVLGSGLTESVLELAFFAVDWEPGAQAFSADAVVSSVSGFGEPGFIGGNGFSAEDGLIAEGLAFICDLDNFDGRRAVVFAVATFEIARLLSETADFGKA